MNNMWRRILLKPAKWVIVFVLIINSTISATTATAVTCDQDFYSGNGVLFYNPCADICSLDSPTSASVGSDSGLPSKTTDYLNGLGVQIKSDVGKDRYLYAESKTGLMWQVLAALHYREAGMDPEKSLFGGEELGSGTNEDGQNIVDDPKEDAVNAGKHFIEMAKGVYGIDPSLSPETLTTEEWGKSFLAYNSGYLYEKSGNTYDQSPYVMNGFDDDHQNMKWLGAPVDPDTSTGAGKRDANKAGTLAILAYLNGMTVESDCSSSGAVPGNIVQTALNYANDTPAENGMTDPGLAKQIYRDAMPQYNGSNAVYPQITDCGRFVSTVLHASGADLDFPPVSVGVMIRYMNESSKYEFLGTPSFSELRAGDIMATPGHIILFTGENNGYMAADASYEERIPSVRTSGSPMWMLGAGSGVWRLK
jgi:hypothetical protein